MRFKLPPKQLITNEKIIPVLATDIQLKILIFDTNMPITKMSIFLATITQIPIINH